jgi:diacylglycerol kinase (ATP)
MTETDRARKTGVERIIQAFRNTANGLAACARSEEAFRQELAVFVVALPVAYVVAANFWRFAVLIGALLLILVVELLNTGLERLADEVTRETNPNIGRIKDMGSAAVGLSILLAALLWLAALAEWLGLV